MLAFILAVSSMSEKGFKMCIRDRVKQREQSREHSSLKERLEENKRIIAEREKENAHRPSPVSYTHLDVYKRQEKESGRK